MQKSERKPRCPGTVSSSCFTSGNHRITLIVKSGKSLFGDRGKIYLKGERIIAICNGQPVRDDDRRIVNDEFNLGAI